MTKKDYQLIARTIRAVYKASITDDERKGVKAVAFALCAELAHEGDRFDANKFILACTGVRQ